MLNFQIFRQELGNYKADFEKYCMLKDLINQSNTLSVLDYPCEICKSFSHIFTKCPFVSYIPDKSVIIKKSNYSISNSRIKIERSMFRTQKSLFIIKLIQQSIYEYIQEASVAIQENTYQSSSKYT